MNELAQQENQRRGLSNDDVGGLEMTYVKGADINSTNMSEFYAAVVAVKSSDVAVLVMGIGTCVGPWVSLNSTEDRSMTLHHRFSLVSSCAVLGV